MSESLSDSSCVLKLSKMEVNKEKIRYILQYHYDQGDKAEQAAKKIRAVYGPNAVSNATAKCWFQRFRSDNMYVKDKTRSGRPPNQNVHKIIEIAESDRHATSYSIPEELKMSQKTVWNHLRKAGVKKVPDAEFPKETGNKRKIILERNTKEFKKLDSDKNRKRLKCSSNKEKQNT